MIENALLKVLRKPTKDRPVLDLTLSAAEFVMDTVTKGDVLEAVPFVNLAMKAVKAKDSIADQFYARKLVGFLNGVGDLSATERAAMAEQLTRPGAAKAGETVLLVLDQITDLDKPELLGRLFKQFGLGHLSSADLRRLTVAVDAAFGDDLRDFLDPDTDFPSEEKQDFCRRLAPTGLTFFDVAVRWDAEEPTYRATQLGCLLFQMLHGAKPADAWAGIKANARRPPAKI